MTTISSDTTDNNCPAQTLLKLLAGKWKPELFKLATRAPLRFNTLLKQLEGSNKQSLSIALKELEEAGILHKEVIKLKPLHIEYTLTDKGKSMTPIFLNLEILSG
ncbi:winged helix-turn-helix transcriptional regulator [Mucilaginibacter auburnensis]|uniref:DNA-binding HxlR family transcriptional regulator n=1 Tax=Mucilaginibacter auburnensis TaxID=1457233 RepID=A0A2H9VN66_9SPHI|nr:helix-turn-helix domain-containing protein [Mucilaginibacter auburnensis]PJJ79768.1 DNA-binding HxlR family transcriptional regulator [Mucilaginibacter auburnensis]